MSEFGLMNEIEFAAFGEGEIGYITALTGAEAKERFVELTDVPADATIYVVSSADGTPLCLTDSAYGALSSAKEQNLEVGFSH